MKYLSICLLALVLITSCKPTAQKSNIATISTFYLTNDSIEGLDKIKFTIDNDENKIYNEDSADFGLRIDSAFPYIAGASALESIIINDDIIYGSEDSTLFLDFRKPVKIYTLATDKKTEKTYTVNVIAHQVNPDTFLWQGVNSQIYAETPTQEFTLLHLDKIYMFTRTGDQINCLTSENASVWNSAVVNNLPKEADLTRIISGLNAMYYADGTNLYATTDGVTWSVKCAASVKHLLYAMNGQIFAQLGEMPGASLVSLPEVGDVKEWTKVTSLPVEFPQTGMTVCVAEAPNKSPRVFVFGGKDSKGNLLKSMWSSDNGSYWADLTVGKEYFTAREYAAMAQYADGLIIFGGKDKDGLCDERLLYSADHGLTWAGIDSVATLPDMCVDRYAASMVASKTGYLYIVGGKAADDSYIRNAWRGLRYASLPGFKK